MRCTGFHAAIGFAGNVILPLALEFAAAVALAISAAAPFVPPSPAAADLHHRLLPAAVITVIFAVVAHRMRAVDLGGAVAGAAASFILYVSGGPAAFLCLGAVFMLAAATTRLGYARKQRLGLAERRHGRNAWQVLANLAAASLIAIVSLHLYREALLLAAVTALAEAAADTVASECGQALSARVYLITSFQRVAVGTDGGISAIGTLCAIVAALLVSLIAAWGRLLPPHWIAASAGAATLGMLFDSLLGATLQARGWLNNSAVNLVSTIAAAGLALLFLL